MTKEELIQAISDDKMMPFIQPEQLAGIVDFVIKNYKPSLPSNLDEAADAYSENILANGEDMFDAIADGFRAGAEWMAGQGVSMQITDETEWADVDSFVHKNVTGGTIIQIRKKE